MIRIVRARTLRTLREDAEAADVYSAEAERWNDLYRDAERRVDEAQEVAAHTAALRGEDREEYEERVGRLRAALADAKAETDATAAVLEEMRGDLDQLRAHASDSETGGSFRAALAYRVLRDAYEQQRDAGVESNRPWDLLAVLLGFDEPEAAPAAEMAGTD